MSKRLESYRTTGHRIVEGWLLDGAIDATCDLAEMQRSRGVRGPTVEIGVHHGRLFILLELLSDADARAVAIDLFEMQDENIDGSGRGSREQLMKNLRSHGCDLSRIELLAENSLRLSAARLVELCRGEPRLFSIDGGHTAEATRNDLQLAGEAVCDGGLVILDDYFNPSWPGVSEGACAFMRHDSPKLVPVLITSNKFFFAKGDAASAFYRRRLMETRPGATGSIVFDSDVVCFEPTLRPTIRHKLVSHPRWLRIRDTPVGQAVRGLKRWL